MNGKRIEYELVSCDHFEAAGIYSDLIESKLSDISGVKTRVRKKNGSYAVVLDGEKSRYKNVEDFLGNIVARLFFF